jgi:hypothetical protein
MSFHNNEEYFSINRCSYSWHISENDYSLKNCSTSLVIDEWSITRWNRRRQSFWYISGRSKWVWQIISTSNIGIHRIFDRWKNSNCINRLWDIIYCGNKLCLEDVVRQILRSGKNWLYHCNYCLYFISLNCIDDILDAFSYIDKKIYRLSNCWSFYFRETVRFIIFLLYLWWKSVNINISFWGYVFIRLKLCCCYSCVF